MIDPNQRPLFPIVDIVQPDPGFAARQRRRVARASVGAQLGEGWTDMYPDGIPTDNSPLSGDQIATNIIGLAAVRNELHCSSNQLLRPVGSALRFTEAETATATEGLATLRAALDEALKNKSRRIR